MGYGAETTPYRKAVLMTFLSHWNALANAWYETPEALSVATKLQSDWLNRRMPRILDSLSKEFSLAVPKNKWSGFVHSGLSHLWQTYMPRGISPKWILQDTRLAGVFS